MTDLVLTAIDDTGLLDAVLFAGDLIGDDSLRTAIFISLFSDAEVPEAEGDRRGWWGDALGVAGDRIGSRLWLLDRSKATPDIAAAANDYARQSLQWLIDDGVARALRVDLAFDADDRLVGVIEVSRPEGVVQLRLEGLWQANFADPLEPARVIADDSARIASALQGIYFDQLPELPQ